MSVHARQTPGSHADILPHSSDFIGGWIIDAQGQEIAITNDMIQQACAELEQHWQGNQSQDEA